MEGKGEENGVGSGVGREGEGGEDIGSGERVSVGGG